MNFELIIYLKFFGKRTKMEVFLSDEIKQGKDFSEIKQGNEETQKTKLIFLQKNLRDAYKVIILHNFYF